MLATSTFFSLTSFQAQSLTGSEFDKTNTRRQILDSSKLKEFADDNFKFHKNGIKLSKRVENTVGKGEIAHYEQFLIFLQCFQKACFQGVSKGFILWEWVNVSTNFQYNSSKTVGPNRWVSATLS